MVWLNLEKEYGTPTMLDKHSRIREFIESKPVEDNGDIQAWLNDLVALQEELGSLDITLEDLAIHVILYGLPAEYDNVKYELLKRERTLHEVIRYIRAVSSGREVMRHSRKWR